MLRTRPCSLTFRNPDGTAIARLRALPDATPSCYHFADTSCATSAP